MALPNRADIMMPKLVTVWREGYGPAAFKSDAIAGLTVSIVALPLSMAIAIASHAPPVAGLVTAIVGGFIISALGGSRHQIGGPAGAFIVLVASIIDRSGLAGLFLATIMAGIIMLAAGLLRFGTYIKYVPYPVTVGFTAGIAAIIFASQIKELLGLTLPGPEPAAIVPKLQSLTSAMPTLNLETVGLSLAALLIILGLRQWKPRLPGFLIAVVGLSVATFALHLDVETIGSRFGDMPRTLPFPALPPFSLALVGQLLPDAFAIALLGSIESLLSAVVADSMTGRRHRSSMELVAQGFANIIAPLFGGITATGTIARTATNVRAGAHGPVSGLLHAVFLLAFIGLAAPLMQFIPLSVLAAILVVVAWNMAERTAFAALLRSNWGDALVLLATFGLTVFRDLTEGIVVGMVLGCLLFMHRMSLATSITSRRHVDEETTVPSGILIHRIEGPVFFGSAQAIAETLERVGGEVQGHVIDFSSVPHLDASGVHALEDFMKKAEASKASVCLAGLAPALRLDLQRHKMAEPGLKFHDRVEDAIEALAINPRAAKTAASATSGPR